jgi:hypothetical protein
MKTSNATTKIKYVKSRLMSKYFLAISIFAVVTLLLGFIYISSQYFNFFYSNWIMENLSFLFLEENKIQLFINIASGTLIILFNISYIFIMYYVYSTRYQKIFLNHFFEELKLNEIYLIEKRTASINSMIEFSKKILNQKKMEAEHLFSLKSLFNLNIAQMYSKNNQSSQGLLISSETDKNFDGFIEIKFKDDFAIDEIENRGLYKFIINFPNKYPYPLYINTNLGILTSKVLDDNILKIIYDLRSYSRCDFTLCMHKNKIFLYINGWELRITDSFRQKLTYNSIDKKIDSFTKLVDDLQNLYICILRNYEVIKYGK